MECAAPARLGLLAPKLWRTIGGPSRSSSSRVGMGRCLSSHSTKRMPPQEAGKVGRHSFPMYNLYSATPQRRREETYASTNYSLPERISEYLTTPTRSGALNVGHQAAHLAIWMHRLKNVFSDTSNRFQRHKARLKRLAESTSAANAVVACK